MNWLPETVSIKRGLDDMTPDISITSQDCTMADIAAACQALQHVNQDIKSSAGRICLHL